MWLLGALDRACRQGYSRIAMCSLEGVTRENFWRAKRDRLQMFGASTSPTSGTPLPYTRSKGTSATSFSRISQGESVMLAVPSEQNLVNV